MTFDVDTTDVDVRAAFGKEAEGKTFLITGPSQNGIGARVATALASAHPKLLILAGRTESKITPVVDEIRKIDPDVEVEIVTLDLLSNKSVREAVAQIKSVTTHVDCVVNNAGVMAPREFRVSEDGVESQFAANHLGHFLLTNLLIKDRVMRSGAAVVNVGSLGYQLGDVEFEDLNYNNGASYSGWKAYGQAKSAQLLGTRGLANKLKKKTSENIAVIAVHPGVTLDTRLLANSSIDGPYFGEAYALAIRRNNGNPLPPQTTVSLAQAAGAVLYAVLNPEFRALHAPVLVANAVYEDLLGYVTSDGDAERLWAVSEGLVGEEFAF